MARKKVTKENNSGLIAFIADKTAEFMYDIYKENDDFFSFVHGKKVNISLKACKSNGWSIHSKNKEILKHWEML